MRAYPPLFNLGFRLFFCAATLSALLAMAWWLAFYTGHPLPSGSIPPVYWHGHEMVFGYSMAVVAGFLLTAVGNWTGQAMPSGRYLALIALPWLIARILFITMPGVLAQIADMAFTAILAYAVARPIIAVKQWRQMGILSKVVLMLVAQLFFLLASLNVWTGGYQIGLYLGCYLIIGLVLTIGRRVTPFFISRGVGYPFEPKNSDKLDRWCLVSFLVFFLCDLFLPQSGWWRWPTALAALATAILQGWRLIGWHTPGIWKKPLLWSMVISLWTVVLGFVLFFLQAFMPRISDSLAMHALTVGGIGIMTVSMMGRVSLGHSGRNIHQPPKLLLVALVMIIFSALFRVVFPLVMPAPYLTWIIHAQVAWLLAFALLLVAYWRIWNSPRADGKPG